MRLSAIQYAISFFRAFSPAQLSFPHIPFTTQTFYCVSESPRDPSSDQSIHIEEHLHDLHFTTRRLDLTPVPEAHLNPYRLSTMSKIQQDSFTDDGEESW